MQAFMWKRIVCLRGYQFILKLIQGILAIAVFAKFKISYEYMMYIVGVFVFFITMKSDIVLDIRGNSENLLALPLNFKKMLLMKLSAYIICDYSYWVIFSIIYILITRTIQSFQLIVFLIQLVHFSCFFVSLYYTALFMLLLTWKKGKNSMICLLIEGFFVSIIYSALFNPILIVVYIFYTLLIRFFCFKTFDSINNETLISISMK